MSRERCLATSRLRRIRRRGVARAWALWYAANVVWRSAGVAAIALSYTLMARPVRALEPELTSDTTLQLYEMRSPSGGIAIPRRRFVTMLGVAGYDLEGKHRKPGDRELFFRARMRVDGDGGVDYDETNPHVPQRFVPGVGVAPVDLMYAYLEGRRYLGGWLGFRVGRQYSYDALGYWSFDGGLVRLTLPFGFAAEAYGGLEVRGGLPLSSPRFERDGVWRGSRRGLDVNAWPSYTDSLFAPAYGANLEWAHGLVAHAKLAYRRIDSTGTVRADVYNPRDQAQLVQGARISSERVAAAGDVNLGKFANLRAGAVYDLILTAPTSVYGTLDVYAARTVTVSADYDFLRPSFDGDSIWNYFVTYPSYDTGLRVSWTPTRHWALSVGSHARALFEPTLDTRETTHTRGTSITPDSDTRWNGGGHLSVRYNYDSGRYGARADFTKGPEGHRVGGDVFAERTIDARYLLMGRVSLYDFASTTRPDRGALSLGMVGGVGYQLTRRARTMLEIENNLSATYGQRWRVLASLGIAVF